jgi:hypothetical protein
MSAAANLTMYMVDNNQTLVAAAMNATGAATMIIPKRIPVDSTEWFKTFGRQFMDTEVHILCMYQYRYNCKLSKKDLANVPVYQGGNWGRLNERDILIIY